MNFFPFEPTGRNTVELQMWRWIYEAFKNDDGLCYHRYPAFSREGNKLREPDFMMVHKEFGIWIFESKGCKIDNIESIQGQEWRMKNWYTETMCPVEQVENQMYVIQSKLNNNRNTRNKINISTRIVLPYIKLDEWRSRGFDNLLSTGNVLLYENLTPVKLKSYIESHSKINTISNEEWWHIKSVIGGQLPSEERLVPSGTPNESPVRLIADIQKKIKSLDYAQQRGAYEIPDGPQRLRGLAGTGKTVVLAKKAVKMHIKHPEWDIRFIFFTQSLYEHVISLVKSYYNEMRPNDSVLPINWNKIKILHAWGGRTKNGFYKEVADSMNIKALTFKDGDFEFVCDTLEKQNKTVPLMYDAILIDEGQDLPPSFYRIAYESLRDPKRLYWAYDEAQSIGSLLIPKPELIFGRLEDGKLKVDLSGSYSGGIKKSHKFKRVYRTPTQILMTAHAIEMGLFRKQGPLQGVTNKTDWFDLGYIADGDFRKVGSEIILTRDNNNMQHPIDKNDHKILQYKSFSNDANQISWIVSSVEQDIKNGLKAEDLMIVTLNGRGAKYFLESIKSALDKINIQGYIAGVDGEKDRFRATGCVTITNIYRAKGNEAWKVYVSRLELISTNKNEELIKRNEAFVALTRAKLWCVVTGIDNDIFDELETAVNQYPKFKFSAFTQASLKRVSDFA